MMDKELVCLIGFLWIVIALFLNDLLVRWAQARKIGAMSRVLMVAGLFVLVIVGFDASVKVVGNFCGFLSRKAGEIDAENHPEDAEVLVLPYRKEELKVMTVEEAMRSDRPGEAVGKPVFPELKEKETKR